MAIEINSFNVSEVETQLIKEALKYHPNAKKDELAAILGVSERTVYRKLIELGEMEPGPPKPRIKEKDVNHTTRKPHKHPGGSEPAHNKARAGKNRNAGNLITNEERKTFKKHKSVASKQRPDSPDNKNTPS